MPFSRSRTVGIVECGACRIGFLVTCAQVPATSFQGTRAHLLLVLVSVRALDVPCLLIQPLAEGRLVSPQVLATTKAATNIYGQGLCAHKFSTALGNFRGARLLDLRESTFGLAEKLPRRPPSGCAALRPGGNEGAPCCTSTPASSAARVRAWAMLTGRPVSALL